MPADPQHTQVNPHARFDAMVLGLPAVDGVPFSRAALEHGDRWFTVEIRADQYNVIDDRTEHRTGVALFVRELGGRPGGWNVDAWGSRRATPTEIELMARLCVAAYAAYGSDDAMAAPVELSRVRLA